MVNADLSRWVLISPMIRIPTMYRVPQGFDKLHFEFSSLGFRFDLVYDFFTFDLMTIGKVDLRMRLLSVNSLIF